MTDLVKEIASLPETVMYDGIEFQFKLFNNGTDDIRITYEIFDVLCGDFWFNPFIQSECSFLYLYENISNEADLRNAIADCREFLISTNIWKP